MAFVVWEQPTSEAFEREKSLRVSARLLPFESNPPSKPLREKSLRGQSPKHPEPKSVRHHWSLPVCVIWRLITLEDCESSSRLGVAFWASKSHCVSPVNEVCEGLEVYLEDLPESSSRLGVAFWASKSHCVSPVNEVCEGLEVYLEDLPEWLGEVCVTLAQGEYGEDWVSWVACSGLGVRDCVS